MYLMNEPQSNLEISKEALSKARTANFHFNRTQQIGKKISEHSMLLEGLEETHSARPTLSNSIANLEAQQIESEKTFREFVDEAAEHMPAQGPSTDSKSAT